MRPNKDTTAGPDRSVCARCGRGISPAEPAALPDRVITGSICGECLQGCQTEAGKPLLDFLDELDVPVLLVDSDVAVKAANKAVQRLLKKDIPQKEDSRGGDVFECAYARLPGGCGRTVHCSGCAIRRAVTETFMTGKSCSNVPAYVSRQFVNQFHQLGLQISTEKVWNMVLLRIDRCLTIQPRTGSA